MGKRVLYISYDGMTDPLGQSQVIPYLKGLSNSGHQIIIVSAEKRDLFFSYGESIRKELVEHEIGWFPVSYSNDLPGISAYLAYRRLRRKSSVLQAEHHFDIIHCRSYIPSLIGLEMKRESGIKFIFDMRGFWADERVEGAIWNLKNPLYRKAYQFFKRKEKEFLKESEFIVSLTENAKREILTWKELEIKAEKISVIPCCADIDFFSERNADVKQQQLVRDVLGINESDFVLTYSGSIGTWYLLDEMLQFFKCLLEQKPNAKFLFITPDKKERILSSTSRLGIEKHRIVVRSAQRGEMPLLLSLSNASIFFIKNSFSKKASSPTKMAELMAMGVPVICNSGVGDNDFIMKQTGAGMVIDSLNEEKFKEAIGNLDSMLKTPKAQIRKQAEQFFSLKNGIAAYHLLYQ